MPHAELLSEIGSLRSDVSFVFDSTDSVVEVANDDDDSTAAEEDVSSVLLEIVCEVEE